MNMLILSHVRVFLQRWPLPFQRKLAFWNTIWLSKSAHTKFFIDQTDVMVGVLTLTTTMFDATLIHPLLKNRKECVVSFPSLIKMNQPERSPHHQNHKCSWLARFWALHQFFWWFIKKTEAETLASNVIYLFHQRVITIHLKHHLGVLTGSKAWYSSEMLFINIPHLSG